MNQTRYPAKPILLVDDEESWLVSIETLLARLGKIDNVVLCTDSSKVMELLAEREFSLILLDYGMPNISGDELLPQITLLYPQLPVIVLTGHNQVDTAVYCKDLGAANYLVKTQDEKQLISRILAELEKTHASQSHTQQPQSSLEFIEAVEISAAIKTVYRELTATAEATQPLLLAGEKGVGKRFLARQLMMQRTENIHELDAESGEGSNFNDNTWVDSLLTDARDGHILLMNVDALDKENQLGLLKLLQQDVNVRFILTLDTIDEAKNRLRADLNHLLQANMVQLPPLRERTEDLPGLTRLFFQQAAKEYGKKVPTPPPELDLLLQSYNFPGNVGELKMMVFNAVDAHRSRKMSMDHFKKHMTPNTQAQTPQLMFSDVLPTIEEAIGMLITEADKRAAGNQSIMAKMLGISRQALNRRLLRRQKK